MNEEITFPSTVISKSIYDFKVDALEGGSIDFSKFKGKKILIVNTASGLRIHSTIRRIGSTL
jgi:glutathione peroxidase-family protein